MPTPVKRDWIALEVTVPRDAADAASNFCHEHESSGVLLEEISPGETRVTAYFSSEKRDSVQREWPRYAAELRAVFPDLKERRYEIVPIENENWAILWMDRFEALEVGRNLMVTPPWTTPEPRGRKVVVIEPAEAFGTGTHETTQGCLVLLEDAAERLMGSREKFSLLDAGCGSGILSIAGVMLGADPVLAADNDPVAVSSAARNAELNGVRERIRFECASLAELRGSRDVVAANLDPLTLTNHLDRLLSLFDRFLIVSGVPADQWSRISGLFTEAGLRLERELTLSEWGAGLFGR
jgi:ribosomal protein L11 methyltransferase